MKILFTGFEPFGGEKLNSSGEAIKLLNDRYEDVEVFKREIPVLFRCSGQHLIDIGDALQPDYIVATGQATGISAIQVERLAVNVSDTTIPDNEGVTADSQIIHKDGANAYFCTLPVKKIVQRLHASGIPAILSNSAGTFVCNHVIYMLLYHLHKSETTCKAGFIHIPVMPKQAVNRRNLASMSQGLVVKALELVVSECLVDYTRFH